MKLTRRQRQALERLTDYTSWLYDEVIEAFFAWSDKGQPLPKRLPPGGAWQLGELIIAHKFWWHSKTFEQAVAEDFKKGLLFLRDFDSGVGPHDDYARENALRVYAQALGQTTHWQQARDWWKHGWRAGYPVAWS